MARIEHIKFIPEVKEVTANWKNTLPSVLKFSTLRVYTSDMVAFHKDKPQKTYNIEYMLTAGDVNDLSIRYHRMFITHELPFNQFEQMDWQKNGIVTGRDSANEFREKLAPIVILSDVQILNEKVFNESTQSYVVTPTPTRIYYLVPYSTFRQCMFVKRKVVNRGTK